MWHLRNLEEGGEKCEGEAKGRDDWKIKLGPFNNCDLIELAIGFIYNLMNSLQSNTICNTPVINISGLLIL